MLYQTQKQTLTNITLHTTPHLSPHPNSSSQFHLQTMKPVENALRGSFINHTSHKFTLNEDLTNANIFNAVASDDFSVDELLDFSKMNGCEGDGDENKSTVDNDVVSVNAINAEDEIVDERNGVVLKKEASDICVPIDDVADLEWLSHFVEDSFTEYSLTCALPVKANTTTTAKMLPVEASGKPTKVRSKRAKNGVLSWSFSGSETTSSMSSSSYSSATSFSSASTLLIYTNQTTNTDAVLDSSLNPPPLTTYTPPHTAATVKKSKFRNPSAGNKTAQIRRCSHCGVQKTPQWRAGPLGAKTLCNACGVRFKSGRLFPEYRPACSPTFSSKLHSNSHRKVLEMRHKKEVELPESGRLPVVSSF